MKTRAALVLSLAASLLAAGCLRPSDVPEAEAKQLAARELSSFASRHGIDPHRYEQWGDALPPENGGAWQFAYRLDGKNDHAVEIQIDRRRRAKVCFIWIMDGSAE